MSVFGLFFFVSVLSGSVYLVIAVAVEGLPPTVVAFVRAGLGASLLMPLAAARGALAPLRDRGRSVLLLGTLEFAAPFVLVSAGAQWIASSLAGILMAAGPLLVVGLAVRFGVVERVTRTQLVGLLIGMSGVIALLGLSVDGRPTELLGAGLVLLASSSFAAGALVLRRDFADVSALGAVAGAMTAGALMLALPALAALPAIDHAPPTSTVLALVTLGVVHAAINYTLFFALVGRLGAARASVTSYVAPAIAVLLGVFFRGEAAGPGLVAGLLLVLLGSWLSTGGRMPPGLVHARRTSRSAEHPRPQQPRWRTTTTRRLTPQ